MISSVAKYVLIVAMLNLPLFVSAAFASEGGGSAYLQGSYGDFTPALSPPPGFHLRNDLVYFDAGMGQRPLGGSVQAGVDQTTWLDAIKLSWMSDTRLLGGNFALAIRIPVVFDVDITAQPANPGFAAFQSDTNGGLGDVYLSPAQINWPNGRHNTTASFNVVAPTGKYEQDAVLNLGRNYWAFDPTVSYTYFHERNGREFSFTTGIMYNLENSTTNYTSGAEFHLDFMLAQHFTSTFALGFTGYWYAQIEDDDGNIPAPLPSGFRGSGVGLGPAFMKGIRIGERDVAIVGKWTHDLDTKHRFDGDVVMLSFAMNFGRAKSTSSPTPQVAALPSPPLPSIVVPPLADSDGDGVLDNGDLCPNTPRANRVDVQGCACDVTIQVQFAYDSTVVATADKSSLNTLAESLSRLPNIVGEVGGYTDSRGTEAYNLQLSKRRAQAVIDYLSSLGISTSRLIAVGHGEADPLADNSTEDGRTQNRRVVLRRTVCQ